VDRSVLVGHLDEGYLYFERLVGIGVINIAIVVFAGLQHAADGQRRIVENLGLEAVEQAEQVERVDHARIETREVAHLTVEIGERAVEKRDSMRLFEIGTGKGPEIMLLHLTVDQADHVQAVFG
jgi:hypothetical protein